MNTVRVTFVFRWLNLVSAAISLGLLSGVLPSTAASVIASDAGKTWGDRRVKTVRPARIPDQLSRYGGAANSRVSGSGFFELTRQSGKWWLIDPEGHLFFSIGVNSVRPGRVGRENDENWVKDTYQLLVGSGFNTLGRWSEPEHFQAVDSSLPWCSSLSFMKGYAKRRPSTRGEAGFPNETIPVFDEEWPKFCDEYAREYAQPLADDPWLLGHFSDNELPFRPDALKKYLSLPENDAGHMAAVKWMKANGVSKSEVKDKEVQAEFLEMVARRYFETVAAALKKADPNHLYIGSRLHGRCISEPVLRAANVCDVVSINYYHAWKPEKSKTSAWEKWSKKPFLVSEFYAMKVAGRKTEADGAGFRVLDHEDAGAFYHTFTAATLRSIPNCVGWHWFKYSDDTPTWQKGIVSDLGDVHQTLIDAMKVLNEQAYTLRGLR